MDENLREGIRFDGLERRVGADQFVDRCEGGAVNLHIYRIGSYPKCDGCEYQDKCLESAHVAGEQAEF